MGGNGSARARKEPGRLPTVLVPEKLDQVSFLHTRSDEDMDGESQREHQMAPAHDRHDPEAEHDARHQRVADEAVGETCHESEQIIGYPMPEIRPSLGSAK